MDNGQEQLTARQKLKIATSNYERMNNETIQSMVQLSSIAINAVVLLRQRIIDLERENKMLQKELGKLEGGDS